MMKKTLQAKVKQEINSQVELLDPNFSNSVKEY